MPGRVMQPTACSLSSLILQARPEKFSSYSYSEDDIDEGERVGKMLTCSTSADDDAESLDLSDSWTSRPEEQPSTGALVPGAVSSQGSLMHGTRFCKPCPWVWRPGGCMNGRGCLHCHLCPEGEVRARKKERLQARKQARQQPGAPEEGVPEAAPAQDSPWKVTVLSGLYGSSIAPPPGLPSPAVPPPPGLPPPCAGPALEASTAKPQLPSVGSALHRMGTCKPCSWMWKPGGCLNGERCLHCHACPQGEIAARRRARAACKRS